MVMRNIQPYAGKYIVRRHTAYHNHDYTDVILTESDILDVIEQYEAHHGPAGSTPRSQRTFLYWWNTISHNTTCSCGIMPEFELLVRIN